MNSCYPTATLMTDILKNAAPWHQYIGAPGLPEFYLYNINPKYTNPSKIDSYYDNNNRIKKFVASYPSLKDTTSFVLTSTTSPFTSKGLLYKNSIIELEISETWDTNSETLNLYFDYKNNPKYNISIEAFRPSKLSPNDFHVKIDINNKTLTGITKYCNFETPIIALELAKELSELQSTAVISFPSEKTIAAVTFENWLKFTYRSQNGITCGMTIPELICTLISGLSDLLGPITTSLVSLVNAVIVDAIQDQNE